MPCNAQPFCKKCGLSVDALKAACVERRTCFGFTYDAATRCGYLKSNVTASKVARGGWTAYELCYVIAGAPRACGAVLKQQMLQPQTEDKRSPP